MSESNSQPNSDSRLAVVVLAAGKGTRMKSATTKVLHTILGRTVLDWVLSNAQPLKAADTVVVVSEGADDVIASLPAYARTAVQVKQNGSGDALAAAMSALTDHAGDVLVINGDGVLFTTETMRAVVDRHRDAGSVATALGIPSDSGLPYGRIIQGENGSIDRIVEALDASDEELKVRELNAGVYCFEANSLRASLPQLDTNNAQGELYITDLIGVARSVGSATAIAIAGTEEELLGINNRADLAEAARLLQRRIISQHQMNGVTFVMPESTVVEPSVRIEADATIEPGCLLYGSTHIATDAVVGPYTTLVDTRIGEGANVVRAHCERAEVGANALVGPFAYLRPGAVLLDSAKAGAFVEVKNATIGARSKVPHLSYIGDASIGSDTNIGAGTITANYRPELGSGKQHTSIGSNVRTGSDNVFVAPVTIGDNAFTAAGSIVVEDVPAGALAIARARQTNLPNYSERMAAKPTP